MAPTGGEDRVLEEVQFMLPTVMGMTVGKRKIILTKAVQVHAQILMYREALPK